MSNKECYWCETLVQALKCLADITRVLQRIHREFQPMINLKNYQIYVGLYQWSKQQLQENGGTGQNFWTPKCAILGPSFFRSQTCTVNRSKICPVPLVPFKCKMEPCKFLFMQKFVGTCVNRVPVLRSKHDIWVSWFTKDSLCWSSIKQTKDPERVSILWRCPKLDV